MSARPRPTTKSQPAPRRRFPKYCKRTRMVGSHVDGLSGLEPVAVATALMVGMAAVFDHWRRVPVAWFVGFRRMSPKRSSGSDMVLSR